MFRVSKVGDALWLGVKAGMVCVWVKGDPLVTHGSYLSALEMRHDKVIYKLRYFALVK